MKKLLLFLLSAGLGLSFAKASTPTLYFTDLTSGPVGAIVTVYGANLKAQVQLNGVSASVLASTTSKVSFIVPSGNGGSIQIGSSNTLPFTVRSGNVYYVAENGSNSASGSISDPWASIPYGFNKAKCGDVVYVMNGVSQTSTDNYGAALSVEQKCPISSPLALIGYPGASVTVGSVNGPEFGIRNPDIRGDGFDGLVFANLTIRGSNTGMKVTGNQYWRIVGNDFSCPTGSGQAGCVLIDDSSQIKFLGNSIHDSGAGGTKYYHSFYATTNSNHIEVGWNRINNNKSCRGVQFYSTSGSPQYDLIVHDNVISGQQCDGINFSTVDATQGPVAAYNNLVYHVGVGGPNLNSPNEACIASLGYGASGGHAVLYGNTLADCGSAGGSTAGAITVQSGSPMVIMSSNLIIQNPGEPIYSRNTNTSLISSSDDVLLTNGPSGVVNSQYQLVAGSPAIGAGSSRAGILYDLAGNIRPQSGASDAGAYLLNSAPPVVSISPSDFAASVVSGSVLFDWNYSSTSAPACSGSRNSNCVPSFALSEGSKAISTITASSATSYSYVLSPLPSIGNHTYTLTATLTSPSGTVSVPVTATITISSTIQSVALTVTLTGTLSDGSTFSISGPVTLSASTNVTGLKSISASVAGSLPSHSAVSASGPLTIH